MQNAIITLVLGLLAIAVGSVLANAPLSGPGFIVGLLLCLGGFAAAAFGAGVLLARGVAWLVRHLWD